MQIRFCLALFMPRIRPNTFNSLECCPNAMAFFYFRIPSRLLRLFLFPPSPATSRKRVTFWPQSRPKKLLKSEERRGEICEKKQKADDSRNFDVVDDAVILANTNTNTIYPGGMGKRDLPSRTAFNYVSQDIRCQANLVDCEPRQTPTEPDIHMWRGISSTIKTNSDRSGNQLSLTPLYVIKLARERWRIIETCKAERWRMNETC